MRNYIAIWFPSILLCGLLSCQNHKQHLEDMKINDAHSQKMPLQETENIRFKQSWVRWDLPGSLRLYDYLMKETEEINNIPCIGNITIDTLGVLYGFIFGQEYELNGTTIPAGSSYETILGSDAERKGYMITLSEVCKIQGYLVRHKGSFLEDYHVDFYYDGSLRYFKPVNDIGIDNIPCGGGKKNSDISLYPDGSLWTCYLAEDFEIEGKYFQEGSQIIFDEDGKAFEYSKELYLEIMKRLRIY